MNKVPSLRFKEFSGEWEEKKLEEYYPFIRNGFVGIATPFYCDNGIKYLQSNNIHDGKINEKTLKYITKEFHAKNIKNELKEDDILMVQSGHAGECAVVGEKYAGCNCHALIILSSNKKSNSHFVSQFLNSEKGKKGLYSLLTGNTITHILASDIKKHKIFFSCIEEQEKIGNFLSSVDKKISIMEEKLNLFNQYKKGIMQKIFSQKLRFKDENGNNYPEWEEKTLNSIFERITEKNIENNDNVLTISAQYGLISQTDFFNKSVAGKDLTKYYLLHKDDFAYNKSYSNGYPMGAIKRLTKYDKGIVSTLYICFRVKNNDNVSFLEQFFESKKIEKSIQDIAQEGARNHGLLNISVGDFFDITINVPCIEEQQKIADFLSAIDDKIENISDNLENLKLFKKSMLQKMFV